MRGHQDLGEAEGFLKEKAGQGWEMRWPASIGSQG